MPENEKHQQGLASQFEWNLPLRLPAPLKAGDEVAIVSPSWGGASLFPHRYELGLSRLADVFGLRLREMPNASKPPDWLAANPEARADDINSAFADKSISALVAAIGGNDAFRMMPHLDLGIIANNPKILLGFSDVTWLHFACSKAGLASFHGPTVMTGFAENGSIAPLTESSLRRALFLGEGAGPLGTRADWTREPTDWADPLALNIPRRRRRSSGPRLLQGRGTARGRLLGGCAEVLEEIKDSPWWPPPEYWAGTIMFLETSTTTSCAVVRQWMCDYVARGIARHWKGVLIGRPGGCAGRSEAEAVYEGVCAPLAEAGLAHIPVIGDLDIGHSDPMVTLRYGDIAFIDTLGPVVVVETGGR